MVKNENKNKTFSYRPRRIGGTTYKVKVVFNDTGHETMEDKILRIIFGCPEGARKWRILFFCYAFA